MSDVQPQPVTLEDELVGLRLQYLTDPKFHALVTIIVREKYRDLLDAKDARIAELTEALKQIVALNPYEDWPDGDEEITAREIARRVLEGTE